MLVDISNYSKPVDLNMHLGKTNIMLNNHTEKATVEVDGKAIEEVESTSTWERQFQGMAT